MSIKLKINNSNKLNFFSGLIVFFFIFFFTFLFSSTNQSAFPSSAKEQEVKLEVLPVLSLSLESNNSNLALSSGDLYFATNKVIVSTNNSGGYTLTISSTNNEADLKHENQQLTDKFTTLTNPTNKQDFPANQWGFSLNDTIYNPISKLSSPAILKTTSTTASGEETLIYFAAKAGQSLLSGRYQKDLLITAVVNSSAPQPIQTTFGGITTMQEMNAIVCSLETTPYAFYNGGSSGDIVSETTRIHSEDRNLVPEAQLTDIRDGKKYIVRKLADGNCWMAQNLDLGDTEVVINYENSNINYGDQFTLPAGSTSPVSWGSSGIMGDNATLRVFNNGDKWLINPALNQPDVVSNVDPGDPTRHIGNYYNTYTATAKSNIILGDDGPSETSICAQGWELPDIYPDASYANLFRTYRIDPEQGNAEDALKLRKPPLSLVLSGAYTNGVIDSPLGSEFNPNGYILGQEAAYFTGNSIECSRPYYYTASIFFNKVKSSSCIGFTHGATIRCVVPKIN